MKKLTLLSVYAIFAFCVATTQAQTISTIAGNGTPVFFGDGSVATAASLYNPSGVAVDAAGVVYIADRNNHCVRKIVAGVITTIAGTGGSPGYTGDGGPATAAKFYHPVDLALDAAGNIYIADCDNNVIRKINTSGTISTIAGTGIAGTGTDGVTATTSRLNSPIGICVDATGNVYISDFFNNRVRKVNTSGIISTVAGTGIAGFTGDGVQATATELNNPNYITLDASGSLFISDNANHRIRKVNGSGIITTVVGNGVGATGTDGIAATASSIKFPAGLRVDAIGNIIFADYANSKIRKVDASGIITTIAGTGTPGFSGDGFAATAAELQYPIDVEIDPSGTLFIADYSNHRIRKSEPGNSRPLFTGGHIQPLGVCEGASSVPVNSQLAVSDADAGQTETWSVLLAPAHGTLVAAYTTTSTGSTLTPSGLTYTPAMAYTGVDVFKVVVTDGVAADTTTINVTVSPYPDAGIISGTDSVCPGSTVTLAETVTGGIWSTSSYTLSYVTSGGIAKGLVPGKDTIIYTVINSCGIVSAIFPFTVRSYISCHTGINAFDPQSQSGISMYPNPSNGNIRLTVTTATDENVRISIFNILGKKVAEQTIQSNKPTDMNLGLPHGIYMIGATSSQEQWSGKLIIE